MKTAAAIVASSSLLLALGCEEKKPTPPVPSSTKAPAHTPTSPAPSAPTSPALPPMPAAPTTPTAPASTTESSTPATPPAPAAPTGTAPLTPEAKQQIVTGLQGDLDGVKSQIETLVSKVNAAPITQKPAGLASLSDIQGKFGSVGKQLTALQSDYSAANWQKMADDAKASMASLKTSVSSLMAQFSK